MKNDLLNAIRIRAVRVAITSFSMRGQGPPGTIDSIRACLVGMSLQAFAVPDGPEFRTQLDRATKEVQRALPKEARRWGTARKALNIYLRDAMYCVYLDEAVHLRRAEKLLELPLDSLTAS